MSRVKHRTSVRRKIKKGLATPKARSARGTLRKEAGPASGALAGKAKARARQVVFVQGGGRGVHDSWDNKLVESLEQGLGAGYAVHYPRMPNEGDPDPTTWKRSIARELRKLSGAVILVAHSVGATILLDYLADSDLDGRLSGIFLIAPPFIGHGGWPSDDLRPTKELVAALPGVSLHIYQGDRDDTVPPSHGRLFEETLPHATVRRLVGRDHQLDGDLSELARDIKLLK